MSTRPLSSSVLVVSSLVVGLTGCNTHTVKSVEIDGSTEIAGALPLHIEKKVDVLLVIDNSGSMGEEQAKLAAEFAPFIETLNAVGADYRIAITTTDIGGPLCSGTATGGDLQMSSCLDRPDSFKAFVDGEPIDKYQDACVAHCGLTGADLEIRPTAVEPGGELLARPWIESYNGIDNLPETIEPLDAFSCVAPQGISGCGWESPLEAMSRALSNMQDPTKPEYGFLRDDALLAVLFVTDEVDCSYNPEWEAELFQSNTFRDESTQLTSAVCWNAGVTCTGDSPYEDCVATDIGPDGQPTSDLAQMVLRPVSHYVSEVEAVAAAKLDGREVLVSVIAGVPSGYNLGGVEQVFADSEDPAFQRDFGIGAGCESEVDGVLQRAVPPVRLETFATAFMSPTLPDGAHNLYSVCDADYSPAIKDIVKEIERELPPVCFPACVRDLDEDTLDLDFNCVVLHELDDESEELPECVVGLDGLELPAGADICWSAKLASECVAKHLNLEIVLVRRPGVSVPSGTEVKAWCEQSRFPDIDCGE